MQDPLVPLPIVLPLKAVTADSTDPFRRLVYRNSMPLKLVQTTEWAFPANIAESVRGCDG